MENEFRKVMSKYSNEQLEIILTVDRKSYKPEAIKAAQEEITKRNIVIDPSKIAESEKDLIPKKKSINLSFKRKVFNKKFKEFSEIEIQKEILFTQRIALDKLERIRGNTSILIWFLILIPIIIGVIYVSLNLLRF